MVQFENTNNNRYGKTKAERGVDDEGGGAEGVATTNNERGSR